MVVSPYSLRKGKFKLTTILFLFFFLTWRVDRISAVSQNRLFFFQPFHRQKYVGQAHTCNNKAARANRLNRHHGGGHLCSNLNFPPCRVSCSASWWMSTWGELKSASCASSMFPMTSMGMSRSIIFVLITSVSEILQKKVCITVYMRSVLIPRHNCHWHKWLQCLLLISFFCQVNIFP